ncbi:NUDIX hydrolase [Candidatus Woesearchaeota archaeon]|nr:NUDIX hydrolase [Candidatus Woesearchaeota archaeon]
MPTEEAIKNYRNPYPTTDLIIEYVDPKTLVEGIVLIDRRNPPYGLALPGGFAEWGISFGDNARKEAKEETNLEVIIADENKPFLVLSDPKRDPRGHMVSICYIVKGYGELKAGDDAQNALIVPYEKISDVIDQGKLAFDHHTILTAYLDERHPHLHPRRSRK